MDPEALALAEIARRATWTRRLVAVPVLLAGLAGGVLAYLALREVSFAFVGANVPYFTAALTMLPALAGAYRLAAFAGTVLVRQRAPAWVDEASARHLVPAASLREFARML